MKKLFIIPALLSCWLHSFTQPLDVTSTFKTIHQKNYFFIRYDNDYFTATDYYYTQGLALDYVHPGLKKNPLTKVLIKMNHSFSRYGLSLNLFGYTPTSILSDSILYGDRPFAAGNSIKSFAIVTDTLHKKRVSSAISIGIIGPAGLGNEIQTGIHKIIKDKLPRGWQYQIRNDIILNYQVNYEKQLISVPQKFLLNIVSELRLGTLDDFLNAGFNCMVGKFTDPYKEKNYKRVEYFFYCQARTNFIGYNATLQGGFFNRNCPYIIPVNDIERVTFQADAGIVVNLKKFYFSYSQSFLTKEFSTGKYHRWGGICMGFLL